MSPRTRAVFAAPVAERTAPQQRKLHEEGDGESGGKTLDEWHHTTEEGPSIPVTVCFGLSGDTVGATRSDCRGLPDAMSAFREHVTDDEGHRKQRSAEANCCVLTAVWQLVMVA